MLKTNKASGVLLHRGIPYHYKEWTTWNGKRASGYGCEHFNFAPYYVSYLPAQSEDEMKACIDDFIDNNDKYVKLRKWKDAACAEYYTNKKPGDYTGD
jgi:hypothetical protein